MEIDDKRIAVLMGGVSNEREISLASGNAVLKALKEDEKLQAIGIDVVDEEGPELEKTLREEKIEIVFIALHGRYGEDGGIQGFLEKLSISYTGSGVVASATCFNKYVAKQLLSSNGISTPPFLLLSRQTSVVDRQEGMAPYVEAGTRQSNSALRMSRKKEVEGLGFPVVVKPCSGGSAIGVSIVKDSDALEEALEAAFKHDDCVLVEKYISGREITVSMLGNTKVRVLPIIEIVPKSEFYDYSAKYKRGMSEHILPARLADEVNKRVEERGVFAYSILGCRGFARIDIIVSHDCNPYLLDINTIPGLTATSLFPEAGRAAGLSLGKLCRKLLEISDE